MTIKSQITTQDEQRARDMAALQGREPVIPRRDRARALAKIIHERTQKHTQEHTELPEGSQAAMEEALFELINEGVIR